jgi:HSP20 family molecular chaperone IbpA
VNLSHVNKSRSIKSSQNDPALFSLAEVNSHYIVAVDLPTIPSPATRILSTKNQLTVESRSNDSDQVQTIFRLLPKGKGIKTIYKDGVLWLFLPKSKTSAQYVQNGPV